MNLYLAARYGEQLEMRRWRDVLQAAGHVVTARWIDGKHDGLPPSQCAQDDLEDIDAADVLIIWSPRHHFGNGRGGRHVEVGYAIGLGIPIILVGERENVFHHLINRVVPSKDHIGDLVSMLAAIAEGA